MIVSRTLLPIAITSALAVAGQAQSAGIERIKGPGPALILQGVKVPAGSAMFYLSGQLAMPIDPAKTSAPPGSLTMADYGDTRTQTISALTKIKGILTKAGYAMSDVVKMTVYVAGDPKLGGKMDFAGMNEGFKMFFGSADNPNTVARSTIQVAALAGPSFLVEIEVTAAK